MSRRRSTTGAPRRFFKTAAQRYAWLNTIVSVGVGRRIPNGVTYDVFELL